MQRLTFTARVQRKRRIAIPQIICKALDISHEDLVEVDISKIEKRKEGVFTPRK